MKNWCIDKAKSMKNTKLWILLAPVFLIPNFLFDIDWMPFDEDIIYIYKPVWVS